MLDNQLKSFTRTCTVLKQQPTLWQKRLLVAHTLKLGGGGGGYFLSVDTLTCELIFPASNGTNIDTRQVV